MKHQYIANTSALQTERLASMVESHHVLRGGYLILALPLTVSEYEASTYLTLLCTG